MNKSNNQIKLQPISKHKPSDVWSREIPWWVEPPLYQCTPGSLAPRKDSTPRYKQKIYSSIDNFK